MAGVMLVQNTVHTQMLVFVKEVEIILVKVRSTCLSNDETDSIVQLLFLAELQSRFFPTKVVETLTCTIAQTFLMIVFLLL